MKGPSNLFEKCKQGDALAQRTLYDLYRCQLMGLARRYARCREDAQDILQEAFIKIFKRFHQVESMEKLESWMKAVVVNTAINQYHAAQRKLTHQYPMMDEDAHDEIAFIGPEDIDDQHLIEIINSLPDGCRLVFNMFAVEGYSHREIAELLQVTEGTSRSQFHHAKQLIKEKLKCQKLVHYYERFA